MATHKTPNNWAPISNSVVAQQQPLIIISIKKRKTGGLMPAQTPSTTEHHPLFSNNNSKSKCLPRYMAKGSSIWHLQRLRKKWCKELLVTMRLVRVWIMRLAIKGTRGRCRSGPDLRLGGHWGWQRRCLKAKRMEVITTSAQVDKVEISSSSQVTIITSSKCQLSIAAQTSSDLSLKASNKQAKPDGMHRIDSIFQEGIQWSIVARCLWQPSCWPRQALRGTWQVMLIQPRMARGSRSSSSTVPWIRVKFHSLLEPNNKLRYPVVDTIAYLSPPRQRKVKRWLQRQWWV